MPIEYKRGHAVNVYFPNDDANAETAKIRPCIILECLTIESEPYYKLIAIPGTDRRGELNGIWIEKNTKEFSLMKLTKPSFINLQSIKILHKSMIRSYRGVFLKMDEIEKLLSNI